MAFSYVEHNGDGATTNFAVTFPYISKNDVSVTVSGSDHPFTWVNDSTVLITPAPAVGVNNVKISRTTQRSAPLVDFYDTDHDLNAAQLLYLAQEYYDKVLSVVDLGVALPLPVVQGGTGAAVPADARTNLGLGDMAVQNKAAVDIDGGSIEGITDLAIADGGTGASDAAGARANLDVYSTAEAAAAAAAFAYSKTDIDNFAQGNPVINGSFQIWQRGASFAAIADGTYHADRWKYNKVGAAVHTVAQSAVIPTLGEAGVLLPASLYAECTTADAAIAAGDFVILQHNIEGLHWLPFAQRTFTLSFWVRATKTGTYCVAFRNSGVDRSYVAEFTVNVTDTWERKTITVAPTPSAGTWDYVTGAGLRLSWALSCGSTFQTTASSWQTGNFFGTAAQVNATDTIGNLFRLAGVQITLGAVAAPLTLPTFADTLDRCQRYYQSSYYRGDGAVNTAQNFLSVPLTHRTYMRAVPTLSRSGEAFTNASFNSYTVNAQNAVTMTFNILGVTPVASGLLSADAEI
jgi:hypothetical protein